MKARYFEAKMKKKLVIMTTGAILLLASLTLLPRWISLNEYKNDFTEMLARKTGLSVAINGDITPSILPNLGIVLRNVTISGDALGGGDIHRADMAINEMTLTLLLRPLFKGKLEFGVLTFVQPVLQVELERSSKTQPKRNTVNKESPREKKEDKTLTQDTNSKEQKRFSFSNLAVQSFQIHKGAMFIKEQKRTLFAVEDMEVRAALSNALAPFDIKGEG